MNREQRMVGGVPDDTASVGSVKFMPGGREIPQVQGVGVPREGVYMATKEHVQRTMHAWRGAELPMQIAIIVEDVEALALEAKRALQAIAAQSSEDIARLTHETRTTFGRVEEAMHSMDSKVESIDDRLQRLRTEQAEQSQRTQATMQSTTML